MNFTEIKKFRLIGLALDRKTSNENGKSAIDCGNLWQRFITEGFPDRIPGKQSDEVYAVYYQYEGDYTKPFSFFLGCKVNDSTEVPDGLDSLIIPDAKYQIFNSRGVIPECITDTWKEVWNSDILRTYKADFEVYGEKSKAWNDAEVEIYISIL